VYPVVGSELCSLILTNWFGSQENFFKPAYGLPGIERVPELPRAWIYHVIISKEEKTVLTV
jgi:hypothetical protein